MGLLESYRRNKLKKLIAKTKARLNAESGVSITISGPTKDGSFVPSIASSIWPPDIDSHLDPARPDPAPG